jgi:hypothetical protein
LYQKTVVRSFAPERADLDLILNEGTSHADQVQGRRPGDEMGVAFLSRPSHAARLCERIFQCLELVMIEHKEAGELPALKPGEVLGLQQTADRDLAERMIPETFQNELRELRRLAASTQAPVAWRWKPRGVQLWIYDPEAGWLAEQDRDTIDVEPLYAAPPSLPADAVRVKPGKKWQWLSSEGWIDVDNADFQRITDLLDAGYALRRQFIAGMPERAAITPDAGDRG